MRLSIALLLVTACNAPLATIPVPDSIPEAKHAEGRASGQLEEVDAGGVVDSSVDVALATQPDATSPVPDASVPVPDAGPPPPPPPPTCAQQCASASLVCGSPPASPGCNCGSCSEAFVFIGAATYVKYDQCVGYGCAMCTVHPDLDLLCRKVFFTIPRPLYAYVYNDCGYPPPLAFCERADLDGLLTYCCDLPLTK